MQSDLTVRLYKIINEAGWTQSQLANRVGISPTALNAILKHEVTPRLKTLKAIDKLYLDIVGRVEVDPILFVNTEMQALKLHTTVKEIITNDNVLDKLTLYLTYHTNTIEGSTMTLSDVKEVLDDDNKVLANKPAKEQIEARNHRAALFYLLDELNVRGKDFKWSEDLILNTHLRLMNTIIGNAGMYRNHGVRISVSNRMAEFVETINKPTNNFMERLAWAHATFEQIHPFSDGNGRSGRLIMFVQALQNELVPPVIVKERKHAYYKYLETAQTREEYELLRFFLAESMLFASGLMN